MVYKNADRWNLVYFIYSISILLSLRFISLRSANSFDEFWSNLIIISLFGTFLYFIFSLNPLQCFGAKIVQKSWAFHYYFRPDELNKDAWSEKYFDIKLGDKCTQRILRVCFSKRWHTIDYFLSIFFKRNSKLVEQFGKNLLSKPKGLIKFFLLEPKKMRTIVDFGTLKTFRLQYDPILNKDKKKIELLFFSLVNLIINMVLNTMPEHLVIFFAFFVIIFLIFIFSLVHSGKFLFFDYSLYYLSQIINYLKIMLTDFVNNNNNKVNITHINPVIKEIDDFRNEVDEVKKLIKVEDWNEVQQKLSSIIDQLDILLENRLGLEGKQKKHLSANPLIYTK